MAQSELFRRAYAQLKAGNAAEARRLFRENEERTGTATETTALLRQAEQHLTQGDLNGAARLYEQLLERNPALPEVYFGLTRIALGTGRYDAARTHATAAMTLAPEVGLTWTLMGLVHEAEGDLDTALRNLRRGVELSPSVFLCLLNLGRVLASEGNPAEGIAPLLAATRLEPGNANGFYTLGMVYKQARQDDNAIRAFEKATELAPKSLDTWATLADVLFQVGDFQATRATLDRALVARGDHPALLEKALAAAMMLNDVQGAIGYVERELALVPGHEKGWLNLANLTLLARDFERSEKAARELLRRNPGSWEAWYHLGNLFEAVPLEREAEEAYRKAVELAPGNWKPLTNLAGLLIQLSAKDKNAEAVPLLEKALTLAPRGEWRVHYNLALAHTKLGQREQALALAQKIQREAPSDNAMVAQARKLESNLREAALRH
ncbi:MAG TPA: tetratricopeptide repeat protein [Myxococcaceae bacterium]|nr:tetratricopeptide repeat protein [Myxococcaceae bacterium]